ncbi:MAG: ABC transporter ATP-binding protein [Treponema sp.]|jgi:putative ABC transport system ATP-binding protein|nr:ABC transporter ATP-binding protein [Treponema sp.]
MAFIEFKNVCKYYGQGEHSIVAVDNMSFVIEKGELCVIVGPSGAGKTTLLNLLGGIDTCDKGVIVLDNSRISSMTEWQLTRHRRYDVGFVFQCYNLIQNLTALENVELASEICREPLDSAKVLLSLGLDEGRLNTFPAQLSGVEQQSVAIARALVKNPKVLLCDEPTGALDYEAGKRILSLLQESSRISGKTAIVITHNQAISRMANRIIHVKNGQALAIEQNSPLPVEQIEW